MDLATWLRQWLARHPLKEPTDLDRAHYTAEVMERVKSFEQPVPALAPVRRRIMWLRPALVTLTAAAAVVLMVGQIDQSPRQVVREAKDTPFLAGMKGTPVIEPFEPAEELAQDVETTNERMLAEYLSEDDQWFEDTLQLLEALDEELPDDIFDDWSDDDWLEELEMLDEEELFASS